MNNDTSEKQFAESILDDLGSTYEGDPKKILKAWEEIKKIVDFYVTSVEVDNG